MQIYGADIAGIDGYLIRFLAVLEPDSSGTALLGLASKVVREGLSRARKAIDTLGEQWASLVTEKGYVIQLEPAETPKQSSGLDLPLAIMLLHTGLLQDLDSIEDRKKRIEERLTRQPHDPERRKKLLDGIAAINEERKTVLRYKDELETNKNKYLLIGTLDITNGNLSSPRYGMFGMMSAIKPGMILVVAEEAETHASIIEKKFGQSIVAYKAANLKEVWEVLLRTALPRKVQYVSGRVRSPKRTQGHVPDLRDVEGVSRAKRAMMVALAGGHNILMVGPPGQGKSMLARAATALLPKPDAYEIFELNKIYSAKGELQEDELLQERPFQEVQSSVTSAALFGGGHGYIVPGLVSLAHQGVLFLDEINLLNSSLIDKLRNTLNDRISRVQRVRDTFEYPCRFIFAAAMNPCKCGWFAHYRCAKCAQTLFRTSNKCEQHPNETLVPKCACSRRDIEQFLGKLSGPLLDRIDLKVLVSEHDINQGDEKRYASRTIRHGIKVAREIQRHRLRDFQFGVCNADIPDKTQFRKYNRELRDGVVRFIEERSREIDTQRKKTKLLLVSRTIADLEGSADIRVADVKEAIELMGLDSAYFRLLIK